MRRNFFWKTLCILVSLLNCISCNQKEKTHFFVRYTGLDAVNGEVAYLWRYSGDGMTGGPDFGKGPIARTIVADGQAGFAGLADTTHLYRIEIGNEGTFFYPEPGQLTLTYTRPSVSPVPDQSSNSHSLNVRLWRLSHEEQFSAESARKLLFAHIQNSIGCYLLNGRTVVYPDELEQLYDRSNESMREQTPVLKNLRRLLDDTRLLNPGDLFVSFRQRNLKGDTVHFADIAGKGIPVALFFWMDNAESRFLQEEIERLKIEYPTLQPVVSTNYFMTPSALPFFQMLIERYQAIILDDNCRFDDSVRRLYRIYNTGFSYEYLFGGDGKLIRRCPLP